MHTKLLYLVSTIYIRPLHINGDLLIYKFQQNLNVAHKIAKDRNSQLMPNIVIPKSAGRSLLSYQKIKRNILSETNNLRRYDNETRRSFFLQQNRFNNAQLNTNIPRPMRAPKVKLPSLPKRQILIQEAFARIENKRFTYGGNLEIANQQDL